MQAKRTSRRNHAAALAASAVVLAACMTAAPASADIYRCKQPDGSLHFTNTDKKRGCKLVVRERRKRGSSKTRPKKRSSKKAVTERRSVGVSSPYEGLISEAATLYRLPPAFIRAVMRVESAFNPTVVSHAGAMGLMQLMPRTAQSMGVTDPFDPRQNVLGGSRYLRVLANRYQGDLMLTIAAYNAGEGAVDRYKGIPPYKETRRYVKRVLQHYYAYRAKNP